MGALRLQEKHHLEQGARRSREVLRIGAQDVVGAVWGNSLMLARQAAALRDDEYLAGTF